ncbi:HmuY family protein [Leptospira sp. 201903070]|uniref:HmuY family protein n=1 Tax=Leptospira ainlahdjerensis TaxID=2810033 RepID=A0ABS2U725_9LEPT|nr:HmuY family protein [Leptospira ainlahdjerensis]MBM9576168.1 HmuY family protein [Leptospira ainlahdjerensis]
MKRISNFKHLWKQIRLGFGILILLSCARQNPAVDETELAMRQTLLALQKQLEDAAISRILSTESNGDGSYTTKVRAISYDVWIKFSFANLSQVSAPDTAGGWDVGFQRFKLQTNSGLTNPTGNGGACMTNPVLTDFNAASASSSTTLGCTNANFSKDTNVSEVAAGGVQTEYVGNDVLNKWFNYTLAFLQPNNKIFIIRSNTGNEYYLFQITGYYSSEGTSAYPTVKWKQIPY